jgi:hypothetical protein
MKNKLLVGGIFCDLEKAFVLNMIFYYWNLNFMESVTRIFNCINLTWVTDIVEQRCIMTTWIVIKFQIGLKQDMESHKVLFWDLYLSFYI